MNQKDREELFDGTVGLHDGVYKRPTKKEMVYHPDHYNKGGIEVLDIIDAFNLDFALGNAIKYILRADFKGNKAQDLQKARFYINHALKSLETQNMTSESNSQASLGGEHLINLNNVTEIVSEEVE